MAVSEAHPDTVAEWRAYVAKLRGTELFEVAAAANGMAFVETLEAEGYGPADIHAILHAFARRFVELDERAPQDGLYDFVALARRPDPLEG